MSKSFLTPINLNKNELQNVVFQKLATAPTSPIKGLFYYDTAEDKPKYYSSTGWTTFGGGTVTSVTLSNGSNSDLSITNGTVTDSGTITITHANVITAQATQAIYPIKIDKNGHITAYGTAVTPLTSSDKGVANGICPLGSDSKVSSAYLPSYMDDIINLLVISDTAPTSFSTGDRYYAPTANLIYTATSSSTWDAGNTPATGTIYIDLATTNSDTLDSYRYNGVTLVSIPLSSIHKYVSTITGNSATSSFTITHSLNTRDVLAQVYDLSTYEEIITDIVRTSLTTITISFATAPATGTNYRVVVIA